MNARSQPQRILIVGGGFAGLAAAVRLAQSGHPVTVFEASALGHAASSQNQGWLYSGALFAREDPALAAACYRAMKQTEGFCPAALEDHALGWGTREHMIFFASREDTPTETWETGWRTAGIPFEELSPFAAHEELPDVDPDRIVKAYRLPDRAFRPDRLIEQLAATARNHGVELRTNTPVGNILIEDGAAVGVDIGGGEKVYGKLVVDATGAFNRLPWSENLNAVPEKLPGDQSLRLLKTHLVSCEANFSSAPFCLLDGENFNALPRGREVIFGSNVWESVTSAAARRLAPERLDAIWRQAERLMPGVRRKEAAGVREWAGVTAVVRDVTGTCSTTPRSALVNHAQSEPPVERLISIYPGRGTLWGHLAEVVQAYVNQEIDEQPAEPPPAAPWEAAATALAD